MAWQCSRELGVPLPDLQGYAKLLRALLEDAGYLKSSEESESAQQEAGTAGLVFENLEDCSRVRSGGAGGAPIPPGTTGRPAPPVGLSCSRHTNHC